VDIGLDPHDGRPASIDQILERGSLRACFEPNEYPSAFFTTGDSPELIGFDVEMAHRFAKRMYLSVEFVPTDSESEAASFLNQGICDVYTRTLPVNWQRTQKFALTTPVYVSSIGLIVRDNQRSRYSSWNDISRRSNLTFAIEDSVGGIARLSLFFPKARIVPMKNMQDQRRLLETGLKGVDAIMDMAEEGAAWTLLYPEFSLVVPQPTTRVPVAYAVARENQELLRAINAFLFCKRALL
jgi:ABC-type amino acid transport substrate-binding protein